MGLKRYKKVLLGLILIILPFIYYHRVVILYFNKINNYVKVHEYLNGKDNGLIGVLDIPKIKLKQGLYQIDSRNNNIKDNVLVLEKTDFPYLVFLAAHSGNGINSYFHKLFDLKIGDSIYLHYNHYRYEFVVVEIYNTLKQSYLEVNINRGIVLTTCSETDDNLQYVVIAK